MNVDNVVKQLNENHVGCEVIKNDPGNPSEIICEIVPTSQNPEESVAIAVIDKSIPHFRRLTTEIYEVIKGDLKVFVEGKEFYLKEGDSLTIQPGKVHYALGDETWIKCTAKPGWKFEDHIIVEQ